MSIEIVTVTFDGGDTLYAAANWSDRRALTPYLFMSKLAATIYDAEHEAGHEVDPYTVDQAVTAHFGQNIPDPDECVRRVGDGSIDRSPRLTLANLPDLIHCDEIEPCWCEGCEADDRLSCGCQVRGDADGDWCTVHRCEVDSL